MDKLASVFLIFAVSALVASATRVRVIRHTGQGVRQPHLHLVPEHSQPQVHHRPHSAHDQTIRYVDPNRHYAGSATARQTGQTQLFNQLAGDHGNVAGAQSKAHKEHSSRDGRLHSLQRLDDGYNRDSGFHNVYSKVEMGHSGEYGSHGGKNQRHSSHGQHDTYAHGRGVADANAHGHASGHLGTYADHTQHHRIDSQLQQQQRTVQSTPRPYVIRRR